MPTSLDCRLAKVFLPNSIGRRNFFGASAITYGRGWVRDRPSWCTLRKLQAVKESPLGKNSPINYIIVIVLVIVGVCFLFLQCFTSHQLFFCIERFAVLPLQLQYDLYPKLSPVRPGSSGPNFLSKFSSWYHFAKNLKIYPKKAWAFIIRESSGVLFQLEVWTLFPPLEDLGIKTVDPCFLFSSGWYSFTHTSQPLHNFGVDRLTHSYIALLNMVQIKPFIAFFLAVVSIADVVAQPIAQPDPFRGMGAVRGAVR